MAKDNLNAGFTGTPSEEATGLRKVAKTATDAVVVSRGWLPLAPQITPKQLRRLL